MGTELRFYVSIVGTKLKLSDFPPQEKNSTGGKKKRKEKRECWKSNPMSYSSQFAKLKRKKHRQK